MILKAHAKINLTLEVLARREDGFHQVRSVLQELDLCDILQLKDIPGGRIELNCSDPTLPRDEGNLAYRAARLLRDLFVPTKGVFIKLIKKIPTAAGLGGGSSDAAAVIKGLNKLWGLSLKKETLAKVGAVLGSDVPFFLFGGTCLAEGRGEQVRTLPPFPPARVLLAAPAGLKLSAKQVYDYLNLDTIPESKATIELLGLLSAHKKFPGNNLGEMSKRLYNDLERSVFPRHKNVAFLKQKLLKKGLPALLSGSGPTVFALSRTENELEEAYCDLVAQGYEVVLTKIA